MLYSITCEYAIRALIRLALSRAEPEGGNVCRVKDIAKAEGIPRHFLGKVFQTLARAQILRSSKGPHGGFALARAAGEITLLDIVAAVDGTRALDRCALGLPACSNESPCPQHHLWEPLRRQIKQYWQNTSLQDLAQIVKQKRALLWRQSILGK